MSIMPTQRLRNIQGSLEKYLQTNLATADGVTLSYPGVPFDSRGKTTWAELAYLVGAPTVSFRNAGDSCTGTLEVLTFQILCFARKYSSAGVPAARFMLEDLVDKVSGRLSLGQEITIYNYFGNNAADDTGIIKSISGQRHEHGKGTVSGSSDKALRAWVLTITLEYNKQHGST